MYTYIFIYKCRWEKCLLCARMQQAYHHTKCIYLYLCVFFGVYIYICIYIYVYIRVTYIRVYTYKNMMYACVYIYNGR